MNERQKNLIHEDPDFGDLLREVSTNSGGAISPEFIEKDYWVTMTLTVLATTGLEIWFKGGTALAKGYGAIKRFSEDLDLKIIGSNAMPLPKVSSWKSDKRGAVESRIAFFRSLTDFIRSSGLQASLSDEQDQFMRSANIECTYQGAFRERLAPPFKPFILLEVGVARVTPFLTRSISSFVHDYLVQRDLLCNYADNRPLIRCVHPLVTLIEKLDAIARHYVRNGEEFRAEKFVRHYDDAAAVATFLDSTEGKALPLPDDIGGEGSKALNPRTLALEMLHSNDIKKLPIASDEAFLVASAEKRASLETAHFGIAPMYWSARTDFGEACTIIRNWIVRELS